MKHYLNMLIITTFFLGCSTKKESQMVRVTELYEKAKNEDIEMFFGLAIQSRGIDDNGNYFIDRIQINPPGDEPYNIPIFLDSVGLKFVNSNIDYDIQRFALEYGENVEDTMEFTRSYSNKVVRLFNKLKVTKVTSYPHLGKFINFHINNEEIAVYVSDTSNVKHQYWIKYFRNAKSINDHWYYKSDY